ncbi:MAG: COP23 domain-containing protein [Trichodesmium sp. MAG_R03]|nr:COP23 domain-containing protein [Trichodesmium sp. MAG_R03]MDE5080597.1 COP23 domain-containing protein [Trichodesmium sp. St18_bin1]
MKHLILALLALTTFSCYSTTANSSNQIAQSNVLSQNRFFCEQDFKGTPTTYVQTERGRIAIIKWVSKFFTVSGYDSQTRCQLVSPQFQQLYNRGQLNYLSAGKKNGQYIICALNKLGGECDQLFTLKPKENPADILTHLRKLASGETKTPYFGSSAVDFNNFLENAPVEP